MIFQQNPMKFLNKIITHRKLMFGQQTGGGRNIPLYTRFFRVGKKTTLKFIPERFAVPYFMDPELSCKIK